MSKEEIKQLAYESGFVKRISKKIEAVDFLALMCLESQKGSPSYNDLASRYEAIYSVSATKQAICKKVNPACVHFFQTVLGYIIKSRIYKIEIDVLKSVNGYKRILVQDSTIIKLPNRLFEVFSGVSNSHSSACNARIQGVYDILSGVFISFSIDSYKANDISIATALEVKEGDLVLRDRGYYSIQEIKRHIDEGADCIYRYKVKTILSDPKTGEIIDLYKLLKKKGSLDMEVCLKDRNHTKVRLLAMPISEELANKRRRKAKKENRGHNPSNEILKMMSWTIFITTISKEKADINKISLLYRLRWRIEIIFKSWKSHMQFSKVHNVSEPQLRVLLTARFIMIVICMHNIYSPCSHRIRLRNGRELSLLKLFKFLVENPEKMPHLLSINEKTETHKINYIDDMLNRYCCYDKRKRLNFNQIAMTALS